MQEKYYEILKDSLEIQKIYSENIAPMFRAYEVYRRKNAFKYRIWYLVSVIIVLLACSIFPIIAFVKIQDVLIIGLLCAFVFCLFFLSLYICSMTRKFEKNFLITLKVNCLPEILKYLGDFEWGHNKKVIADSELNQSGLFADFNKRTLDDEFQGSYKGVNFDICETELLYETNWGGRRTTLSVFKGVIMSFDLGRTIKSRTIVSTKGDLIKKNSYLLYLIPFLYSLLELLKQENLQTIINGIIVLLIAAIFYMIVFKGVLRKRKQPFERVSLEDPKFNKKFDVYSSVQLEARYFVTPAFMERFQNLNTVFGSKKAKCSFYGDKLMIAISTNKNLFEIGQIYKTLENPETIHSFYKEVSAIYQLIDYFKLDEKIYQ